MKAEFSSYQKGVVLYTSPDFLENNFQTYASIKRGTEKKPFLDFIEQFHNLYTFGEIIYNVNVIKHVFILLGKHYGEPVIL